ncbi:MAG TPA: hypothetical protein VFI31_05165, partial [Pirellulales bacterium]|nr:hypothetical protein [Pirellulales bacterium]
MASPFAIFRKNQKAMYALLAILCMVGFSIGGALDYSNQMRSGADPVVATAYGKSIHASEVQRLRRNKITAINFVDLAQRAELGFTDTIDQNTYEYFMNNLLRRPTGTAYFGPPTEESVVHTWVLDERARKMGMVISDDAINKFLHDVTHDKVKPEVFGDIARQLNVSQPQLFEALRGELMSLRLQEMALGRPQTTPAQRWDYYRRQKQRATVELAAVPVETLVGEVPDATDEELKAFFEKHKEQEPDPESPTPGFKVPQKAAFQVVVAKFNDFYDENSVTDEEIKKHYEEFKDTRYLWEQFDTEETDEPEAPAATEKTSEDGKPADEKTSAEKEAAGKAEDKDDDAGDKPTDKGQKPVTKADDKSQSSLFWHKELLNLVRDPSAVMAGLLAADDTTENEKPGDADEKPADKAGSSPDDAAGEDTDKTAAKKDAGAADKGDLEDAKKPAGDSSSKNDKTAEKKSKSSKPPAIAPQITDEYVLHRDIREGPHPKHAPFWKVEDVIRKELAREKANKKMQEALDSVRSKMRTFARKMGPDDTEQKMPGLDKLAAAQGLNEVETGLLTARELREKFPDLAEAK